MKETAEEQVFFEQKQVDFIGVERIPVQGPRTTSSLKINPNGAKSFSK